MMTGGALAGWKATLGAKLSPERERYTVDEAFDLLELPAGKRTQMARRYLGRVMRELGWEPAQFRVPGQANAKRGFARADSLTIVGRAPRPRPRRLKPLDGALLANPGTRIATAAGEHPVVAWIVTDGPPVPVTPDGPLRDTPWTLAP